VIDREEAERAAWRLLGPALSGTETRDILRHSIVMSELAFRGADETKVAQGLKAAWEDAETALEKARKERYDNYLLHTGAHVRAPSAKGPPP
jgi:hypothetical protein